jgi:hypothetical protein
VNVRVCAAVPLFLCVLVSSCADLIPTPPGPVLSGTWGGDNAGAIVSDSGAHVHIGCTAGDAKQPFVTDSTGHFLATGLYNVNLYPIAVGPDHPARFSGAIVGSVMTLTVALTDTAVTLGPVRLVYGKEPVMGPCPICRRPGEARAMRRP